MKKSEMKELFDGMRVSEEKLREIEKKAVEAYGERRRFSGHPVFWKLAWGGLAAAAAVLLFTAGIRAGQGGGALGQPREAVTLESFRSEEILNTAEASAQAGGISAPLTQNPEEFGSEVGWDELTIRRILNLRASYQEVFLELRRIEKMNGSSLAEVQREMAELWEKYPDELDQISSGELEFMLWGTGGEISWPFSSSSLEWTIAEGRAVLEAQQFQRAPVFAPNHYGGFILQRRMFGIPEKQDYNYSFSWGLCYEYTDPEQMTVEERDGEFLEARQRMISFWIQLPNETLAAFDRDTLLELAAEAAANCSTDKMRFFTDPASTTFCEVDQNAQPVGEIRMLVEKSSVITGSVPQKDSAAAQKLQYLEYEDGSWGIWYNGQNRNFPYCLKLSGEYTAGAGDGSVSCSGTAVVLSSREDITFEEAAASVLGLEEGRELDPWDAVVADFSAEAYQCESGRP